MVLQLQLLINFSVTFRELLYYDKIVFIITFILQVIHVLLEALHQMLLVIYALWASTALMEVLLM